MHPHRRKCWRPPENSDRRSGAGWFWPLLFLGLGISPFRAEAAPPFALPAHRGTPAYLAMPEQASGFIPERLSETGA